ncbi:NAD(P)-binding domain-containing protein [Streptomyces collinus]
MGARAGHTVRAWNRSRAKAEPLTADGIPLAHTPAEAVEGAEVALTMLYDGPAALDVMKQAAPALRPGAAWVQSTTRLRAIAAPMMPVPRTLTVSLSVMTSTS